MVFLFTHGSTGLLGHPQSVEGPIPKGVIPKEGSNYVSVWAGLEGLFEVCLELEDARIDPDPDPVASFRRPAEVKW